LRFGRTGRKNKGMEKNTEADPVLEAADATCVECGEIGHLDCGPRDPAVRAASPLYLFAMGVRSWDAFSGVRS
jgi:hypothetical protein